MAYFGPEVHDVFWAVISFQYHFLKSAILCVFVFRGADLMVAKLAAGEPGSYPHTTNPRGESSLYPVFQGNNFDIHSRRPIGPFWVTCHPGINHRSYRDRMNALIGFS